MRFIASIQYDGANFYGFQRLNKNRSVQNEIEKVLTKLNKTKVFVKGAGRTDRGVHAKEQVCHFDLNINITEHGLKQAMNSLLPSDIYVNYIKIVDNDFHARFLVKEKTYQYVINVGEYNAIDNKYLYNYCRNIDILLIKKISKILIGKKSFKAFVSGERESYNSYLKKIKIKKKNNLIFITFIGTSFYRYMVRNMVGSLLAVSEGKITKEEFTAMVNTGNKIKNYLTVPSSGLYLENIKY